MRRPSIPKLRRPSISKLRRPPIPKLRRPSIPKRSGERPPLRVIVIAVLAILLFVLLLRACGSDDEKEVRETVERFGKASREKDYQALCDELFSKAIVQQARSAGQPCEIALRIGLGERQNPTLEVRSVKIDGDEALAQVDSKAAGERPSKDTVRLVREDDGWRIADLANEAPPDPTP
ncbi:MAG: nuclear transport factor 2 family protein [Actinomycetota bacterium]|nr:nuclear transport factor 2 family protein [Actinomycetota bacterium]